MAMCCASFAPSRGFQDFLKSYIAKNFAQPQLEVQNLAPYCFWRLEKTLKSGPARQPPRLEHIDQLLVPALLSACLGLVAAAQLHSGQRRALAHGHVWRVDPVHPQAAGARGVRVNAVSRRAHSLSRAVVQSLCHLF